MSGVATNQADQSYYAEIFERVLQSAELERLLAHITSGRRTLVISGLAGSARALLLAALEKRLGRLVVFVARSNREVEEFQPDIEFFYAALNAADAAQSGISTLPALEADPYDGTSPHAEVLEQRALALYHAAQGETRILLASLGALAERTASPTALTASSLALRVGEEMPPELIVDLLIASGYVRAEPVGAVGEFSLRGGILDVFSPTHPWPHRIEFFGDSVESIREFDPDSQRSIRRVNESTLVPMRDVATRREEFIEWADAARERWADEKYKRHLRERVHHAERGETFAGWEYLIPLIRPLRSSAFDYFKDAVFVVDEPAEIETRAAELYDYLETRYAQADDAGEVALRPDELFLTREQLREHLQSALRIELRLLGRDAAITDEQFQLEAVTLTPIADLIADAQPPANLNSEDDAPHATAEEAASKDAASESPEADPIGEDDRYPRALSERRPRKLFLFTLDEATPEIVLLSQSSRRYHSRVHELARDLAGEAAANAPITLFAMASLGLAERTRELLEEYGVIAQLLPSLSPLATEERNVIVSSRIVTVGKLANGFALPSASLNLLTEGEVFGESEGDAAPRMAKARLRKQRKASAFLSDLGDLKVGDFVVHVDHGIGQFQGLQQINTAGSPTGNVAAGLERLQARVREFMLLTFAEGGRLYVPVERLDLVQKYSAGEGHEPKLDRLGGVSWEKAKARVKRAMRDMAEELLKLYAERKLVKGHAYGSDSPWQKEFEDAFEYQLTPDQEAAIADVKADMESPEPTDRLIVGDVGYGKTEVAMRAAFKALMDGKQVAVLAPTTVLVYQHFKTFQQRFQAFPIKIEMLSRFVGTKEQKEIIKRIEAGGVDVAIGTHRLLSKDIHFKDLGLLVVDEEQRFGVAHKERIKQMRKKVDVLAMSATPIPRTLNMSLAGLRDMSIIETPPRDRLAIQTHVVPFSDTVIRSAIELELQRRGQVFFVHNRIETIFAIAELVSRLVPEARLAVGHGQMDEKQLEDVILKFIRHELDVLVSTTIIENGIDIPLANTIIINRADRYGLAQLYQLRGRVGRSNRRAYAYLLIPSEEGLTPIARRRLAAIREFSDLGAGFRIAALDLELRGAGNLLGGEQSGHIEAIGFDLYTQMLERTVRELKGEAPEEEISAAINLGVDIRIPEEYIFDVSQRLRTYKRISSAEDDEELADIHAEVADRYGPIPETVETLFEYARLRHEASRLGVLSIDREGEKLAVKFDEKAKINPDKLIAYVAASGASFTPSGVLKITLRQQSATEIFAEVRTLLQELR